MDTKRTNTLLAFAVVALTAFIAGFAVSWAVKPETVQVVEVPAPIEAPVQSGSDGSGTDGSAETGQNSGSDQQDQGGSTSSGQDGGAAQQASGEAVVIEGNRASDSVYGVTVERDGTYTSKYEVALYIHAFGDVPSNYITKSKARDAGWVANRGNLWEVLPGRSIGGGGFENIEGEVPLAYDPDRTFKECDIGYEGGYRGAERLVWSDDGYIFYTPDHYESFEQLYPHEEG